MKLLGNANIILHLPVQRTAAGPLFGEETRWVVAVDNRDVSLFYQKSAFDCRIIIQTQKDKRVWWARHWLKGRNIRVGERHEFQLLGKNENGIYLASEAKPYRIFIDKFTFIHIDVFSKYSHVAQANWLIELDESAITPVEITDLVHYPLNRDLRYASIELPAQPQ
uniref:Uncharacterized protein n=1 Tax=viral metagenome TaxID=1070528 RepID=A0A6M3JPX8_9ZZZZ